MAMSIHHEPSNDEVAYTFIEQGIENKLYEDQQEMLQKKLSYYSNLNPKSIYNKYSYQEKKFNEYLTSEFSRKIPTYEENLCSLPSDRTLNSLYKAGSNNSNQKLCASFLSEKSPSSQYQQNSELSKKRMLKKRRKRNFINNVEKQHKSIQMPEENYKSLRNAQKGQLIGDFIQMQNSQKNSKKSKYYQKERSDSEIQQNGLKCWLENEIEEEKQDNTHYNSQENEIQEKQESNSQEDEDFYQKKHQRFYNKMKISSILSQVMEKIEKESPNNTEKSEKHDDNIHRKNSNLSLEQKNASMNNIEESKDE